jgi:hypothetical protein
VSSSSAIQLNGSIAIQHLHRLIIRRAKFRLASVLTAMIIASRRPLSMPEICASLAPKCCKSPSLSRSTST